MAKITRQQINDYSWQTATLQNGWVVYDNDAPYGSARYRRDELGNVYLNLMIKNGTTTSDTVITNLPVGYRPPVRTIFTGFGANGALRFDVLPDGKVNCNANMATGYSSLTAMFKAA